MKAVRKEKADKLYYYETRTHSTQTDRRTDKQTEREWMQILSFINNNTSKYIQM